MSTGTHAKADTRRLNVRRYYDLVDAGDLEGVFALMAQDVVYRRPGYEPIVGLVAFKDFYRATRVIVRGRHTVRTLAADGDVVASDGSFEGVLRDGRRISCRWADMWRFRGALVSERDTYFFMPLI